MEYNQDTYKIQLASLRSKQSLAADTKINLELYSSKRLIDDLDYRGTVNLYDIYLNERDSCTLYRLVVTIEPLCSNVLFNPCSIIVDKDNNRVYNSGTSNTPATALIYSPSESVGGVSMPVSYYCGMDIFDNVGFRTKIFKRASKLDSVHPIKLGDTSNYVHSLKLDDVVDLASGINDYLTESNGWIGFKNPNKLTIFKSTSDPSNPWVIEDDFSPMIKGRQNCDTIDMFPNREMFSFNSIVEYEENGSSCKILKEENWSYSITYPYKNKCDHWLTFSNGIEGIPIMYGRILDENDMGNIYTYPVGMIQTAYSHNLSIDDEVVIESSSVRNEFNVIEVIDKNTFYIRLDGNQGVMPNLSKSRMRRIYRTRECKYYIRVFRKLPNWKYEEEEITKKNIDDRLNLNNIEFANNKYGLSYARTVFSDAISQIVFTDSIDIKLLRDNLNRPLSEIYLSIRKNNEGDKNWSSPSTWNTYETKYQRYWSRNTSGFELVDIDNSNLWFSSTDRDSFVSDYPSIYYMHNLQVTPAGSNTWQYGATSPLPYKINIKDISLQPAIEQPGYGQDMEFPVSPSSMENDLDDPDKVEFYGDICEWDTMDFKETVLESIQYRFNTSGRESFAFQDKVLTFHQIFQDDYDKGLNATGGTKLTTNYIPSTGSGAKTTYYDPTSTEDCCVLYNNNTSFIYRGYLNVGPRPEGYYYKAHYPFKLKWYSRKLQQKSLAHIDIVSMQLETCNGIDEIAFITTKRHLLLNKSMVRISFPISGSSCNEMFDKIFEVSVPVIDKSKFLISYDADLISASISDIRIRYYDKSVPDWSQDIGDGRFIWRDLLLNDEQDSPTETHEEYPYTNDHFYIHKSFKFYLKRQGKNLYYGAFPNDLPETGIDLGTYENVSVSDIC